MRGAGWSTAAVQSVSCVQHGVSLPESTAKGAFPLTFPLSGGTLPKVIDDY